MSIDGKPSPHEVKAVGDDMLELTGNAFEKTHSDSKTGVAFVGLVKVLVEGGSVKAGNGTVEVSDAAAATMIVALGTSLYGNDARAACGRQLAAAAKRSYDEIRRVRAALPLVGLESA